ncbi:MAG: TadE/TadG family type IV pilus assembly protein [Henriciella sp.]
MIRPSHLCSWQIAKRAFTDTRGSVLVEFSVIAALMLLITFSIVEFALVYNKFNSAQKATQAAARVAATRLVLEGIDDCGGSTSLPAGTDCADVPGSGSWTVTCTGSGGSGCNANGMAEVLLAVQQFYPEATASDISVQFSGTQYGFVGRGKPVPAITVSVQNISYDFVTIGQLLSALDPSATFAQTLNIASAQTTIIGEDIGEGVS